MAVSITGPIRPHKAFHHLDVNPKAASVQGGILEDVIDNFASFDASKGYFDPTNQRVYDALWSRVFTSLTGEILPDCVNIWLLPEDQYLPRVREVFSSDAGFYQFTGYKPMDVQGVNIDGTWIIYI